MTTIIWISGRLFYEINELNHIFGQKCLLYIRVMMKYLLILVFFWSLIFYNVLFCVIIKVDLKKGLLTPALTEDRWLLLKTEV